jgi:hypothetical protein
MCDAPDLDRGKNHKLADAPLSLAIFHQQLLSQAIVA